MDRDFTQSRARVCPPIVLKWITTCYISTNSRARFVIHFNIVFCIYRPEFEIKYVVNVDG
jgi:hypothetical protein